MYLAYPSNESKAVYSTLILLSWISDLLASQKRMTDLLFLYEPFITTDIY